MYKTFRNCFSFFFRQTGVNLPARAFKTLRRVPTPSIHRPDTFQRPLRQCRTAQNTLQLRQGPCASGLRLPVVRCRPAAPGGADGLSRRRAQELIAVNVLVHQDYLDMFAVELVSGLCTLCFWLWGRVDKTVVKICDSTRRISRFTQRYIGSIKKYKLSPRKTNLTRIS